MVSLSSIEIDSLATTRESFKDCILPLKIRNQMHINFEEREIPQAVSCNFAQIWLFSKAYVLYNIYSFICGQRSWRVSNLFQGKLTFTWKIYWTAISIEIILHQIFRTDIFQNSYFLLVIENQQNLSPEVKN